MDNSFVKKLTEITEANLSDPQFGGEELAHKMGTSYSNLRRKVHTLTGKSVNQFIREIRLDKAMELIQQEELTAAEVSFKTGFSSPAWFSNCFHEYFGFPPGEARKMQVNTPEGDNSAASPKMSVPAKESGKDEQNDGEKKKASEFKRKPPFWIILLGISVVIAALLIYPRIFRQDNTEYLTSANGKISIAIMPFKNQTNDATLDFLEDGIQVNLINSLSNSEELSEKLSVKQSENLHLLIQNQGITNYASITPAVASSISKKLDARVYINGIVFKSNETIRINVQLVNTKTAETIQTFQKDGTVANIFPLIDSIKVSVRNYLIMSILKKKLTNDLRHFVSTTSPDAFKSYLLGQAAFFKGDNNTAKNMFMETLKRDSNFYGALFFLSVAYLNTRLYDEPRKFAEARKYCLKVYDKRDQLTPFDKAWVNWLFAWCVEIKPLDAIKHLNQLLEMDDQQPNVYYQLGLTYKTLYQFNKAIPELEKSLEIYDKWNIKPMWAASYSALGDAYHQTGQYKKEKKIYKNALKVFAGDPDLIYRQAILSLSQGDTAGANRFIEKYKSNCKDNLMPDSEINRFIASIYSKAGILGKAEEYYRKALLLEPEKPARHNDLAYFLIDNNRNIIEGMELVNKALESSPDSYLFLATKGWGLFKQGKIREAYEILQKSWDLRLKNGTYEHPAFLHLEEAKKAIADQKMN